MTKYLVFALLFVFSSGFAQNQVADSLQRELKIMELKLKQMELNRQAYSNSPSESMMTGNPILSDKRWEKYYNAKNNITLNAFVIFIGGIEIGYERLFNNSFGIRMIGGFYTSENPAFYNFATFYEGYRGEIQARWYLEKGEHAKSGIPFFIVSASYKNIYLRQDENQFFSFSNSNSIKKSYSSCIYPSALFGYRRHIYKGFFAELTAGVAYNFILDNTGKENVHIPIVNPYTSATQFRSTFVVGTTF